MKCEKTNVNAIYRACVRLLTPTVMSV